VIALLARALDRVILSLPLVLVALLALGSYWMLHGAPAIPVPQAPGTISKAPDYVLEEFSVQKFDAQGRLSVLMTGESAQSQTDTPWIEVRQFVARATDANGLAKLATADLGLSSADSKEFQLKGHARLLREADSAGEFPRLEISSEFLHLLSDPDRVESTQPVQIVHGKHQFTADLMRYDGTSRVLQLDGRVRAVIASEAKAP
jgi:lipopolysaccharide export system protein LptC